VYAGDGVIYRNNTLSSFVFDFAGRNDLADVISNRIEPLISGRGIRQFYYGRNAQRPNTYNFPRPDLVRLDFTWNQSTTTVNETTGFFYQGTPARPQAIGSYVTSNARYIERGALVKFVAPAGYFFDANNRLVAGTPVRANEKLVIWATTLNVILEGTNQGLGNLDNGVGPVTLNNFVPSGAIPAEVIPKFVTDLPVSLEQSMIQQMELARNFGIGYNNLTATWYLITSTNLAQDAPFSLSNAQNTQGLNLDASWLIQFVTDGESYTVVSRQLDYVFASVLETRFYFDGDQRVYDSRTGSIIKDFIRVLKSNSRPNSNFPLNSDVTMDIVAQPTQSDGFVNDYEVLVSYQDSDEDGIPDNPDFFDDLVEPNVGRPLIFLQLQTDFDDLERYLPVEPGIVNDTYATVGDIELVKSEFVNGQVFYAFQDRVFVSLSVTLINGVIERVLLPRADFLAYVGRQSLAFQYRHNSPLTNVIDPGVTNIIDLYVVVEEYYNAYQNWIKDVTGTVPEPAIPTINQLSTAYSELNSYKMVSDNIVLNSVVFKPLFGAKAAAELKATIKVVRAPRSTASISEIKSQVIQNINTYFTIDKWDFGDTFFFSELAAYLHERMGSIISSVVLVPLNPLKSFGDLYEVRCAPNEIFVSAATVNDVEVITALTQSNIRSQTSVSGLAPVTSIGAPGPTIGQTGQV
jgi:hypothetical protein